MENKLPAQADFELTGRTSKMSLKEIEWLIGIPQALEVAALGKRDKILMLQYREILMSLV